MVDVRTYEVGALLMPPNTRSLNDKSLRLKNVQFLNVFL
jgi:hypothetical protein